MRMNEKKEREMDGRTAEGFMTASNQSRGEALNDFLY